MLQESVKRKERRQCPRSHPKAAPEPNLHNHYEFFSDRSQGGLITGAANPKIQRTGAEISRLSHKLLPAADLERWIDRITEFKRNCLGILRYILDEKLLTMQMSWLGNHHNPSIGCKIGSRNTRLTHENLFCSSHVAVAS
jgi:hypothetical protein